MNHYGFSEDSKAIIFDSEKIKENKQQIIYLYGQLNDTHRKEKRITPSSASIKYNGEKWTTNSSVMMEFLHLGSATLAILPFRAETMAAGLKCQYPTLSPKDPKFAEWYKGYEAQMKKSEGPTIDEK